MPSFQELYEHSIITHYNLNRDISKKTVECFPTISSFTAEYLAYIQYIGKATQHGPYTIEMNPISSYLVLYTLQGTPQFFYNNQVFNLEPNTIVFINCSTPYSLIVPPSITWSYYWVYVNGASIQGYFHMFHMRHNVFYRCPPNNFQIKTQIEKLLEQFISPGIQDELSISLLIHNLLTTLLTSSLNNINVSETPQYILRIKELFDTHYSEHYTLQQLATLFKVSKYTLAKQFSAYVHQSPIDYLIERRIEASKELLWSSDLTIGQIASCVGFENTTHFINTFKSHVGITPLRYRKTR